MDRNVIKKKYDEFLQVMELFFGQEGYQKTRKKGEYHKLVSGKIIKIRIVLSSVRRSGSLGEIRAFAALEYPEIERMISTLKEEQYRKGNDIFYQDIALLCGENSYYALNFSCDSNMEYIGAAMRAKLAEYVFPIMSDYEDDEKILHKFERDDTIWRKNYFSGKRPNIDFYLRWVSLCILRGYIQEAFIILENIPGFYGFDKEIAVIKDRLKVLCLDKRQTCSFHLLVDNKVKIKPGKEDIKKGLLALDGLMKYFLILEESGKGNYLQIAGGSGEFTVEIRKYYDQEYKHYRAEMKNEDKRVRKIFYGEGYLSLPICQVLSIDQAYEIASQYLIDQELHRNYNWVTLDL